MNHIVSSAARMSHRLMGGAAIVMAAAITAFAPPAAQAQGKASFNGGTGCANFTTFNYDSGSNTLTVNCTATQQQPQPTGPGTFSIQGSGTTISAQVGTTINVVFTRTNGTDGAYSLGYGVADFGLTGWSLNGSAASGSVNFAAGEGNKTLSFVTGSTAGRFYVELGGANGPVATTSSGSLWIDITTAPVQPQPTPTPTPTPTVPGCTTAATHNEVFQYGNQKVVFALKPGETGAVSFTPGSATGLMYLSTTETVNTPSDADHEVTVSTCPGDFTPAYPCRYQANYVGTSMQANIAGSPWQCPLRAGTTFYMNVRHVKLRNSQSDPVQSSCTSPPGYTNGACEVRLQNTGL